jgi:hypothetical protein
MTFHGDYSPEARAAAQGRARAAGVFAVHAETIVAALPDVPADHVLVAVVDETHAFTGTHHVPREEIAGRVPELEGEGWALVVSPGADVAEIRRRTDEMGTLARRRAEMITRILARRGAP